MTVLEAIQKGTDFLARKEVESARLNAELLLAHLLKLERLRLYLQFERQLAPPEADQFRELLVRRGKREPLQHITGSTSFCGLQIAVTGAALVPRPETELLAEHSWKFLEKVENPTFLEIGAGTGCVSIAIAHHVPSARGVAIEISPEALALAKANIERHSIAERVEVRPGNMFEGIAQKFDAIVSNPPYIASSEIATLSPDVRDYDPRPALDGGADGLDFYRRFATEAAQLLESGGQLLLEFGDGQGPVLKKIFAAAGWSSIELIRDLTRRERVLITSR